MEWFEAFNSFLLKLQWIDWYAFFCLVIGLIYGAIKGLVREVVEILELILIISLVTLLYGRVAVFLHASVEFIPNNFEKSIAFGLTTVVVWIAIAFIVWIRTLGESHKLHTHSRFQKYL